MPIYEYRAVENGCPKCLPGFERLEKMSAPVLTECPSCGVKVERIVSSPSVPRSGPSLSPENLDRHGFTQYRKSGDGVYEKTAGKGPRTIHRD